MKENKAVENALGTIGAVLWAIQIIPQIVKSYRTKSTKGLSASLMFVWGLASLFLGSYAIVQRLSIPLQIQPQVFGALAAGSWCQCLHYENGWSKKRSLFALVTFCAIFAGFEAGSVFGLWKGQDRGVNWPIQMYGYITAILLAVALLPQYYEIYRLRQVVGISLSFMAVDILGGIFSFLSLFFRTELDKLAFASYLLVVILDGVVVVLAFILNPIAKRRELKAKAEEEGRAEGRADSFLNENESTTNTIAPSIPPSQSPPINEGEKPSSPTKTREQTHKDEHGHEHEHENGLHVHDLGLGQGEPAPMHFRTISRTST